MYKVKTSLATLFLATSPLIAHLAEADNHALVEPIMIKNLADIPGKEVQVLSVVYPPGSADPVHRHNAHGFIYVLEGCVEMQVRGGDKVVLMPGQTFYEGPDDVHTVGRNCSNVLPAKFLVFLLKNQGTDVVIPVE